MSDLFATNTICGLIKSYWSVEQIRFVQANLVGARHGEQQTIARLLAALGLQLEEVPSDGDCMFAAIRHQVSGVPGIVVSGNFVPGNLVSGVRCG
jgi:hypothetical protein